MQPRADKLGKGLLGKTAAGEITEGDQLERASVAAHREMGQRSAAKRWRVCPRNDRTLLYLEKYVQGLKQIKLGITIGALHILEEYAKQIRQFELYVYKAS